MKKIISILLVILLLSSIVCTNYTFADSDIDNIKRKMQNVGNAESIITDDSSTAKLINTVIGIIQFVGTGISLIVISLLGIKYLLASPGEKADVKKSIMPVLIGCILLFAAVNIVGVVEKFTNTTLPAEAP